MDSIDKKVSDLFEYRVSAWSSYADYLNQLNALGKITQRSTLDLLAIILDHIKASDSKK